MPTVEATFDVSAAFASYVPFGISITAWFVITYVGSASGVSPNPPTSVVLSLS